MIPVTQNLIPIAGIVRSHLEFLFVHGERSVLDYIGVDIREQSGLKSDGAASSRGRRLVNCLPRRRTDLYPPAFPPSSHFGLSGKGAGSSWDFQFRSQWSPVLV